MIWGFEKLKLKEQSMGFTVTESMTRASVLEFNLHLREKALDAACALEPEKMFRNTFLSRRLTSYHLLYGIRMWWRIALALFRFKFSTAVPFQHRSGREYAMALLFSIFNFSCITIL